MKIGVIGCGYVGLVSGACLSDFGHNVVCLDKNKSKVGSLNSVKMPIYEMSLEKVVERNISAGRLAFSTNIPLFIEQLDVLFIAVDTPTKDEVERVALIQCLMLSKIF